MINGPLQGPHGERTGRNDLPFEQRPGYSTVGDLLRRARETRRELLYIKQAYEKGELQEPDPTTIESLKSRLENVQAQVLSPSSKRELRALVEAAGVLSEETGGAYTTQKIERARKVFQREGIDPDLTNPETKGILQFARELDFQEQLNERSNTPPVRKSAKDPALYSKTGVYLDRRKVLGNLAKRFIDPYSIKLEVIDESLVELQGKPVVKDGKVVEKYLPNRVSAQRALHRAIYLIEQRAGMPWMHYGSTPEEQEIWNLMKQAAAIRLVSDREARGQKVTHEEHQTILRDMTPKEVYTYFRKTMDEFFASGIIRKRLDDKWRETRQSRSQAGIQEAEELTEVPAIFSQNDAFFLVSAIHDHYGALIDCGDPDLNQLFYVEDPRAQTAFLNAKETLISAYGFGKRGIPRPSDTQLMQGRQKALDMLSEILQSDTSVITGKNLLENSTPQTLDALQTVLEQLHVICSGELADFYVDFLRADVTETTATYGSGKEGNIVHEVTNQRRWKAPEEMARILKAMATTSQSDETETQPQARVPFPVDSEEQRSIIQSTTQTVRELTAQYGNNERFLLEDASVIFTELFSNRLLQEALDKGYIDAEISKTKIIGLDDLILVAMMRSYDVPDKKAGVPANGSSDVQTMIRNALRPQRGRRTEQMPTEKTGTVVPIISVTEQEASTIGTFLENMPVHKYMHVAIGKVLESDPAIREIKASEKMTPEQMTSAITQRNLDLLTLETITSPVIIERGIRIPGNIAMQAFQKELGDMLRTVQKGELQVLEYLLPDFLLMATVSYFDNSQSQVEGGQSVQNALGEAGIDFPKFWLYMREVMKNEIANYRKQLLDQQQISS